MRLPLLQRQALQTLKEHLGEGAVLKNGNVFAAGIVLSDKDGFPYTKQTWARLRAQGLVESAGRIRLALKGHDFI